MYCLGPIVHDIQTVNNFDQYILMQIWCKILGAMVSVMNYSSSIISQLIEKSMHSNVTDCHIYWMGVMCLNLQ